MEAIHEGLSIPKFVRWCREQGLSDEVYNRAYPHPYLILWLESRRRASILGGGVMQYPESEKGYLDQDADLMLAFEVLDEIQHAREEEEKARTAIQERMQELFNGGVGYGSGSTMNHFG